MYVLLLSAYSCYHLLGKSKYRQVYNKPENPFQSYDLAMKYRTNSPNNGKEDKQKKPDLDVNWII